MSKIQYWSKLNTDILGDYEIASLPDDKWRQYVEDIIYDPKNIHCDPSPLRKSWSSIRIEMTKKVFQRDEHKCKYCGSIDNLEIDHIKPLARGGSNDLDNLQILCGPCNRRKWAK
jgi:hypothetical protein